MKKIRIYKAIPAYYGYLTSFYLLHPELKTSSFSKIYDSLKNDSFQWLFSWGKYNNDPDVEVFETISNDYYLQNAWAGGKYTEDSSWLIQIVLEQIKEIKPDVCLLYSPETFNSQVVEKIREIDNHMVIGGYDGMDRKNAELFKAYDFVITCSDYISAFYKNNNIPTYPMCFGFDEGVLDNIKSDDERKHNVSFSGSLFPGIHDTRFDLVSYLSQHTDVTISSEYAYSSKGLLSVKKIHRQLNQIKPKDWKGYFRVFFNNKGPLYGLNMYQFLRDSKIVLNAHGDRIHFAANIRLFEATGVGACLLTDWKENIGDLFEPGREVLTYQSKEEALDIIRYCEMNPVYSQTIAANGQKRAFDSYSQRKTVPEVIGYVKSLMS